MYRFQIIAHTQMGESIGLVGSTPELGEWDVSKCLHLQTNEDQYPVWWVETDIDLTPFLNSSNQQRIEYKYVRFYSDGGVEWETVGPNRWLPCRPDPGSDTLTVDDGAFGYLQPWPYAYWDQANRTQNFAKPLKNLIHKIGIGSKTREDDIFITSSPQEKSSQGFQNCLKELIHNIALLYKAKNGLKIVVIGSSVALGHNAWLTKGWTGYLQEELYEKYGHQLVNVSLSGSNVTTTIDRFSEVVTPEKPDIVIIALSLGNEGLAHCPPHERAARQRKFETGLQELIEMVREIGAFPMLGSVYPNGDYTAEHYWLLQRTHQRMLSWGIPILDWLSVLDDGQGRWREGTSFDPAHPNSKGHRLMYEAINLNLFDLTAKDLAQKQQILDTPVTLYKDDKGLEVLSHNQNRSLQIVNSSANCYIISSSWQELQTPLQKHSTLEPGIYLSHTVAEHIPSYLWVRDDKVIETTLKIPPSVELEYSSAFEFFSARVSQVLFYDGQITILKQEESLLRIINESNHEYNLQPMWKEVRQALKGQVSGVYTDVLNPDLPFRTMMIGADGLESRVKVPPLSSLSFKYQCPLSEINRVAILPIGDRCAIRMVLHKMEYDGPAYPFDLTRTTNLSDVTDIIENGFFDMWNPDFLHYNHEEARIYHGKWTGLSFAHEIEETDDPLYDFSPVYERMRYRYEGRSQRFLYTLNHCDEVLFIRTGMVDKEQIKDFIAKLEEKCQGKPFRILIISPQPSEELAELTNVVHYDLYLNPDHMYEDLGYWMHCTEVVRSILDSLGVSSKNLFWCPPKIPK
ncbi:DUF1796 family putative cysteine peptidase [Crocosphaera watsonii]|nr:DUF1796 family putative cysteine peptidase [Crocosphaera watsonii]